MAQLSVLYRLPLHFDKHRRSILHRRSINNNINNKAVFNSTRISKARLKQRRSFTTGVFGRAIAPCVDAVGSAGPGVYHSKQTHTRSVRCYGAQCNDLQSAAGKTPSSTTTTITTAASAAAATTITLTVTTIATSFVRHLALVHIQAREVCKSVYNFLHAMLFTIARGVICSCKRFGIMAIVMSVQQLLWLVPSALASGAASDNVNMIAATSSSLSESVSVFLSNYPHFYVALVGFMQVSDIDLQ